MLKAISADLKKHYYDPKLHGVDWDAKTREVNKRIEGAPNLNAALAEIAKALDSLNDSHTVFIPPRRNFRLDYEYGIDAQAIYVTCNIFNFPLSPAGSFIESSITVMSKSEWINPTGTIKGWVFVPVPQINDYPYIQAMSIQPAIMHDAADTDGEFLAYAFQGGGAIGTIQITNPLNCCGLYPQAPGFSYAGWLDVPISAPPDAAQEGNSEPINTGDGRLLFANWNSGNLSLGLNSNCNGYSCAGFIELTTATNALVNVWGLQEVGNNYFYPSVDSRPDAWKTMTFGTSNSGLYPSSGLTGIPPGSSCTSCTTALETQQSGVGPYDLDYTCQSSQGQQCRWGDYLGAARDPDGSGIWVSGEFASAGVGFGNWNTWITATYNDYYAAATFSPGSLAFGNQQAGTASAPLSVTVSSVGNATLLPSSYSATAPFSILNSSTCSPYDQEPGTSCTFNVGFSPQTVGIASGALYLYDNATPSPQTVLLSGIGTSPSLSFTPLEINFGTELIDNHSKFQSITLRNTSASAIGPLKVSPSRNFKETNTCATGIPTGGACTVTAAFNPLVTGPITGTVSISGAFIGSPGAVPVSGLGTAVSFVPLQLHYAVQKVGTTSPVKTITVKNHLGTALAITSIVPQGDFAIFSNTCGSQLAGGKDCVLGITFTPTAAGTRTGTITLADSDPASPQVLVLTGLGKN